jgi:hypothetical protein
LQDKAREKKMKGKKVKKEPYSLSSKHHDISKNTTDPYKEYINFYTDRAQQNEMFDAKYARE